MYDYKKKRNLTKRLKPKPRPRPPKKKPTLWTKPADDQYLRRKPQIISFSR